MQKNKQTNKQNKKKLMGKQIKLFLTVSCLCLQQSDGARGETGGSATTVRVPCTMSRRRDHGATECDLRVHPLYRPLPAQGARRPLEAAQRRRRKQSSVIGGVGGSVGVSVCVSASVSTGGAGQPCWFVRAAQ